MEVISKIWRNGIRLFQWTKKQSFNEEIVQSRGTLIEAEWEGLGDPPPESPSPTSKAQAPLRKQAREIPPQSPGGPPKCFAVVSKRTSAGLSFLKTEVWSCFLVLIALSRKHTAIPLSRKLVWRGRVWGSSAMSQRQQHCSSRGAAASEQ